jgi:hypothetical protein
MATVEGLSRPISARQVIARASFRLLPGWELVTDLSQKTSRKRSGTRANASRNGSLPASPGTGAGWQAPIISIHVWLVCLANSAQLKPCGQQTVMTSAGATTSCEPRTKQLWCYGNTLEIFKQRHITGRIAWSHEERISTNWGALC